MAKSTICGVQPTLASENVKCPSFNVIKPDAVVQYPDHAFVYLKRRIFSFLGILTDDVNGYAEQMLYLACHYGNELAVKNVLENCSPDVNFRDQDGNTCLCKAVSQRKDKIAMVLLRHPNIDVNKDTLNRLNYRRTPLHIACETGSLPLVNLLIASGSDVNKKDGENTTPLYIASGCGHSIIVKTLIRNGADVTICKTWKDEKMKKSSPLHAAVFNCHLSVVKILCDEVIDVNQLNSAGQSALFIACSLRHTQIIETLLQNGASANLTDSVGQTPLMCVLEERSLMKAVREENTKNTMIGKHLNNTDFEIMNLKLMQMLIDAGANIDAVDNFGYTAFDYCIQYGIVKAAAMLVRNGAHAQLSPSLTHSLLDSQKSNMLIVLLSQLNMVSRRFVSNNLQNMSSQPGKAHEFKSRLRSVGSLQECCRLHIRQNLKFDMNMTVLEQIESLPITETMKDFLSLKDLCNVIINHPT